jgi:dihydrofolate reductase
MAVESHRKSLRLSHTRKSLSDPVATAPGSDLTDGIHSALEQAKDAAGEKDVRLGGGVSTIRQYLSAGLIDELHLAIVPVLLGDGEHLLGSLNLPALGYECVERNPGARATHVTLRKRT